MDICPKSKVAKITVPPSTQPMYSCKLSDEWEQLRRRDSYVQTAMIALSPLLFGCNCSNSDVIKEAQELADEMMAAVDAD